MLSLSSSVVRLLRRVGRRAGERGFPATVIVERTGEDGRVFVLAGDVVVRLSCTESLSGMGRVVIPWSALPELPIQTPTLSLSTTPEGMDLTWTASGVPQSRRYGEVEGCAAPGLPDHWHDQPATLLGMVDQAYRSTATQPSRYALTRVLFRGSTGQVIASDGKQLLIQGGLDLPFKDDLLVARSGVFATRELVTTTVALGRTPTHLWVRSGAWTIGLTIDKDGRFPNVNRVEPPAGRATRWQWTEQEAEALRPALQALPGQDDTSPVTIDLNGHAAVRSRDDRGWATEIVMPESRVTGSPVRVATPRNALDRALQLGFDHLEVTAPDQPLVCRDQDRVLVWMPHAQNEVVASTQADRRVTLGTIERKEKPPEHKSARPRRQPKVTRPAKPESPSLVEEVTNLRRELRELYGRSRRLEALVRQQARQDRRLRSTLASLKAWPIPV